jgi:hypothetical protein
MRTTEELDHVYWSEYWRFIRNYPEIQVSGRGSRAPLRERERASKAAAMNAVRLAVLDDLIEEAEKRKRGLATRDMISRGQGWSIAIDWMREVKERSQ